MKKSLLFIAICIIGITATAQFSESFFNGLGRPSSSLVYSFDQTDGIPIPNGFLGVYIADSAGTNIQFVTINYGGSQYQTYSSTLPAPYGQSSSAIIDTYQSGNETYVVVADYTNSKIGVIHYTNYVFTDYVDYTVNLFNTYYGSWHDAANHTVAIYAVTGGMELKRYKFDLNVMSFSNEQLIDSGFIAYDINHLSHYHRFFLSSNGANEVLYYVKGGKLQQAQFTGNNLTLNPDIINCDQLFGLYTENGNTYLTSRKSDTVNKYLIANNLVVNTAPASSYVSSLMNTQKNQFARLNGFDFWVNTNIGSRKIYQCDNSGNIVSTREINPGLIKKFVSQFGKIFSVGSSKLLQYDQDLYFPINYTSDHAALFLTYDDPANLFSFKEFESTHQFGRFNFDTSFGTGLFDDPTRASAPLRVDTSNAGTIYASHYSITGKSTDDSIRGDRFLPFQAAIRPGPYTNPSQYAQEDLHKYYESFAVDVYMVGYHLQQILSNNTNYIPPKGILNWPANGDVSKGQAAQLAPYIDMNGNGVYEPMLGDCPDFPGTYCVLTLSHDPTASSDTLNNTGLELYSYLYYFDCDDPALKNTIFNKLVIKNRGGISYDSLFVGVFNDFDIGDPGDDYVGFNVGLGLNYAYNGDNNDEGFSSSIGFGTIIPSQGFCVLKSAPVDGDGIDNAPGVGINRTVNGYGFADGIVDNEYWGSESNCSVYNGGTSGAIPGVNDDMNSARDNYLFVNNRFKDSTHFIYGKNIGYIGAAACVTTTPSNIKCKYVYTGTSDPLHYGTNGIDPGVSDWSEIACSNPAGDRRGFSSGAAYRLLPDSSITFDGAFVLGDGGAMVQDGINNLFANTQAIRNYFQNNQTPCGQDFGNVGNIVPFLGMDELNNETFEETYSLYPNPTNERVFIKGLQGDETITVMDFSGKLLEKVVSNNQIDLSNLADGLYFVIIQNGKQTKSFKVVKR